MLRRCGGAIRTPRPCWLRSSNGAWRRPKKSTVGMFAIALWDRRDRTLHLARDRFGEKPLYYGWVNGAFVFGSELKACAPTPALPTR